MRTTRKGNRRNRRGRALGAFMLSCMAGAAAAAETQPASFAFGTVTKAPAGYVDWCRREQENCAADRAAYNRRVVRMTQERFGQLAAINDYWNGSIEPLSDMENYGLFEYWTLPSGRGDCEDYVLAKRKSLIDAGWPRETLLITVVRDRKDEGHAVLTVLTTIGMLVLDNLNPEIRAWDKTGYRFVKLQNPENPYLWVSADTAHKNDLYVTSVPAGGTAAQLRNAAAGHPKLTRTPPAP